MTVNPPSTFSDTSRTSAISARIASASRTVSVVVPCVPVRAPATLRDPASTQIRLSPSLSSSASAASMLARPSAITVMTIATATAIPSIASPLRTRLRDSARTASTTVSWTTTRSCMAAATVPDRRNPCKPRPDL
jgi:hypothetical protein